MFSYRKRSAEGTTPDVFVYDKLPEALRVQIIYIWRQATGRSYSGSTGDKLWTAIHDTVAEEHGEFTLGRGASLQERCENYLLGANSIEYALDLIEVSFVYIDSIIGRFDTHSRRKAGISIAPSAAIEKLNERFRRADVGYQFEGRRIIRVDSELIHSEIVKPALGYLSKSGFDGPRDEFLNAHAHYRAGEMKDATTDANNAFESALKAVCDLREWSFKRGARASDLLKIVRENGLLPGYLDNSFDQLSANCSRSSC